MQRWVGSACERRSSGTSSSRAASVMRCGPLDDRYDTRCTQCAMCTPQFNNYYSLHRTSRRAHFFTTQETKYVLKILLWRSGATAGHQTHDREVVGSTTAVDSLLNNTNGPETSKITRDVFKH